MSKLMLKCREMRTVGLAGGHMVASRPDKLKLNSLREWLKLNNIYATSENLDLSKSDELTGNLRFKKWSTQHFRPGRLRAATGRFNRDPDRRIVKQGAGRSDTCATISPLVG